jgi:uncharacterized membrane protein
MRAWIAEAAFYLVAVLVLAALVHFAAILLLPLVAEQDAYSRLAAMGPAGATLGLPQTGPNYRGFGYEDPAVASAFCRFDLTNGPIRVRAPTGRAGFASLSFHSRRGAVFYALTDRAAVHDRMEAVIVTASQLRALVAKDDEDNPSEDLRIVSPTLEGFVLTRVLSELPSLYGQAATQAAALGCAPEPPPK